MDNRVRIVVDMYHERFDTSYHKEQGDEFLLQPSAIGNLMNIVDHVHHMVKNNYANIAHYTANGKLNYLQHLYVVFTELRAPAQMEILADLKSLRDIFSMYYQRDYSHFSNQSELINKVFDYYSHTRNDEDLPSKIAHKHKLCKDQKFERFLQSVVDRADDAFESFYSLKLNEIEDIFQAAMKSNEADVS